MYWILEKPGHWQVAASCLRPATPALAVPAKARIEVTCILIMLFSIVAVTFLEQRKIDSKPLRLAVDVTYLDSIYIYL
jgi:hypothetical protein